jgi:DNA-binding PadR family transcriptional regulator
LEKEVLSEMQERIVKSFLDVLILTQLRNGPKSGYDIIDFVHKKFNIILSSGTAYATLYALERNGLIQGNWAQRKRVYSLTDKGEKKIYTIQNANAEIQLSVAKVFEKSERMNRSKPL